MPKLSTHVLDLSTGKPATGVRIELIRREKVIGRAVTNPDGRTEAPLLERAALTRGEYTIRFHIGDYFASLGHADAKRFLDVVPIVFVIDDASRNYHVPLLVSPWAYSTYRGS